MAAQASQHVSFVLLAEFDINQGSILPHQYPFPTGTDDQLLAELMIPDGAHSYAQDWTIFFLNQCPANTISPVFSDTQSIADVEKQNKSSTDADPQLLYVINLVRTKKDSSVKRGSIVKALAICTRYPFIQIFQPVLLVALDDYFSNPSVEVLARLFDAVNSMDMASIPVLTRSEKLVLRASERKDAFVEKFTATRRAMPDQEPPADESMFGSLPRGDTPDSGIHVGPFSAGETNTPVPANRARSSSVRSFASTSTQSLDLGGEAWTRAESGDETEMPRARAGSGSIKFDDNEPAEGATTSAPSGLRYALDKISLSTRSSRHRRTGSGAAPTQSSSSDSDHRPHPTNFDTHFYPTQILLNGINLPIKIPTSTFVGEVGDYSLIQLISAFSTPTSVVSGPLHPHLHSNGALTHPIILLFNALVTQKRVMFLGYGRPANLVANFVLAACALASGCGAVLRGFTQRAFPYTNLTNNHVMVSVPGFIAGSTNPVYKTSMSSVWDVLCDIETGSITVNKDIRPPPTNPAAFPQPPAVVPRSGIVSAVSLEDDMIKATSAANGKADYIAKADNADNIFMEDILTSIAYHYGESLVRARFTDYVQRFVRLAARYEEDVIGTTKIGFPSVPFSENRLGSGMVLEDTRELSLNSSRIEGWRRSDSYEYYKTDFQAHLGDSTIQGYDLPHQIFRLRNAKSLSDSEALLIMSSIANGVRSYEQIVELLAWLPPHAGGLLPFTFGLFHPQESIRDCTVDFLTTLRAHSIGLQFLQSLNHFHRMTYVRLAQSRDLAASPNGVHSSASSMHGSQRLAPPANPISRSSSNLSSSSLAAG